MHNITKPFPDFLVLFAAVVTAQNGEEQCRKCATHLA